MEHSGEIAHLRQEIERICEAAKNGLNGYAVTANHAAINARQASLAEQLMDSQQRLEPLVGEDEARNIVAETYLHVIG